MTTSRLVRPSFRASRVSRSSTASGKRTEFLFSSILTIYPSLRADDEPEPAALGRMPRRAVLHIASMLLTHVLYLLISFISMDMQKGMYCVVLKTSLILKTSEKGRGAS